MEAALAPGGIRAVLQPVFELSTARVVGYEALARFDQEPKREPSEWFSHPDPAQGRLLELAAVKAHLSRFADLPERTYLALNVSPATAVCDELDQILREFPPDRLVLEIGLCAASDGCDALRAGLAGARSRGIRLAVDDAGAGCTDLRLVAELAPDIIKLDLSITQGIDKDATCRALASAIIGLAGQLGIAVVAEGIETAGQFTTLLDMGVSYGQGYFLAHPSSALFEAIHSVGRPRPHTASQKEASTISVAVVDDHAMVAQSVAALLDKNPRLIVTGVALDLAQAESLIDREPPDVVVCDIQLGDDSGFTLLEKYAGRERPRFVMYTSYDLPVYHRAAFEGGAAAFVLKMAQPSELVAAIIAAATGEASFSSATMRAVRSHETMPTDRELAVLEHLADGQSTADVASALAISPRTVESHLRTLFDRAGVMSRTELVLHAIREGWIRPSRARSGNQSSVDRRAPVWLVDAGLTESHHPRGGPEGSLARRDDERNC